LKRCHKREKKEGVKMQFLKALAVGFIWPERKIKAHLFDPISSFSVQFWDHEDRKILFKVVPTLILVDWHDQNTV
jgi:hypothetical protein